MDPNVNLAEQLKLATSLVDTANGDESLYRHNAFRLAELVLALDEWISRAGALPKRWKKT